MNLSTTTEASSCWRAPTGVYGSAHARLPIEPAMVPTCSLRARSRARRPRLGREAPCGYGRLRALACPSLRASATQLGGRRAEGAPGGVSRLGCRGGSVFVSTSGSVLVSAEASRSTTPPSPTRFPPAAAPTTSRFSPSPPRLSATSTRREASSRFASPIFSINSTSLSVGHPWSPARHASLDLLDPTSLDLRAHAHSGSVRSATVSTSPTRTRRAGPT